MTPHSSGPRTANLLYNLLGLLREQAAQWRVILRREPLLSAFLTVNFLAFSTMVVLNYQRAKASLWSLPLVLPLIWLIFYGGIFLAMVFVARTTGTREEPVTRFPRVELLGLLLYLFGFLFLGGYCLSHGRSEALAARGVVGMARVFDLGDSAMLRAVSLKPSGDRLELLRTFHFVFLFPAMWLLALGNHPRRLGFRRPLSAPWTILLWALLPAYNLLSAVVHGGNAVAAMIGALILVGMSEEFTFRAALQTRLEVVLGNPVRGLVLSSVVFALLHLNVPQPDPLWAWANALGAKAAAGFLLGYLYYRTRSLVPGLLLHGALDVALFAGTR